MELCVLLNVGGEARISNLDIQQNSIIPGSGNAEKFRRTNDLFRCLL